MKKFLFVCIVIFTTSLACKKEPKDGGLCACTFPAAPTLQLAVKNSTGQDLLNTSVSGSYGTGQIQLFQKDNAGNTKQIQFRIKEPFNAGKEKFEYYQIESVEIMSLANQKANQVFYLKLGSKDPLEITMSINGDKRMVSKLLIDKKEVPVANAYMANYINLYAISL